MQGMQRIHVCRATKDVISDAGYTYLDTIRLKANRAYLTPCQYWSLGRDLIHSNTLFHALVSAADFGFIL